MNRTQRAHLQPWATKGRWYRMFFECDSSGNGKITTHDKGFAVEYYNENRNVVFPPKFCALISRISDFSLPFAVPDTSYKQLVGSLIYTDGNQMGVRFSNVPPSSCYIHVFGYFE